MKEKKYDYIIIGAGWGGLSQAALHANDGKKVLVLEAYDRAGGFGHSFSKKGYSFCAEMQYLQGCQQGWKVYDFLEKLGLDKKIKFNSLDRACYDKVVIPGADFEIPLGVENYIQKIIGKFPDEKKKILKFFDVMRAIAENGNVFREIHSIKKVLSSPIKHFSLIRYFNWTLQDFFDHLKMSKPLQAILSAQIGDVALSPEFVSMEAHADIIIGYTSSSSFPKKGMGFFIDEVVKFIRSKKGVIKFNHPVEKIITKDNHVTGVIVNGKKYKGKRVISNMDPQLTFKLIGNKDLPLIYSKVIDYKYSVSCFSVFLGLKGIDITKYGFGKWNIWHYPLQDINKVISNMYKTNSYKRPFLFISTPSIYADPENLAPKGCYTMQIVTLGDYDYFKNLKRKNPKKYELRKKELEEEILSYVEKKFIPDLRKHIDVKEVWTPLDLHKKIRNPQGNIYGEELTSNNLIFHKVSQETPFDNLFLVGATTGYPGLLGVITGSLQLYEKLK